MIDEGVDGVDGVFGVDIHLNLANPFECGVAIFLLLLSICDGKEKET